MLATVHAAREARENVPEIEGFEAQKNPEASPNDVFRPHACSLRFRGREV
jgi:hypothetical protein